MSIKVQNLSKYYGTTKAVDNISFEINTGEVVGFLGPNGAGKTTTMKILTCYLPPTSGNAEIDGIDVMGNSQAVRQKIGYLPELNPLYNDMNVVDFIKFSGTLYGMKGNELESRLKFVTESCGLTKVKHKDIDELSKGYRQRVGLAQALVHDPEVLILDEPTSGLDPNQIIEIRNLIKSISSTKTVILSTHILSEVQASCDRVIIINNGKIVADGKTGQLSQGPKENDYINLELKVSSEENVELKLAKLREIPGSMDIEMKEHTGGSIKFRIQSSENVDLREQIMKLVVSEDWVLLGMNRETASLEEVFHKLTLGEVGNIDHSNYQPK
jgi:ABC-2 type transport system ATP-binding protein